MKFINVRIILGALFIAFGVHLFFGTNNTRDTNNVAYDEAKVVISNSEKPDEGSVIARTGQVTIADDEQAEDQTTGLSVKSAYLKRKVEMYQWVRDCGDDGDDCRYQKEWSEETYDSSNYDANHKNTEWALENQNFFVLNAKLGDYRLDEKIMKELPTSEITEDLRSSETVAQSEWKFKNGYYYKGEEKAKVGDVRIKYEQYAGETVSVLAMLSDGVLKPFKASNGVEVYVVHEGKYDADALLKMAHNRNTLSNIVMIILCLALAAVGVLLVMSGSKQIRSA